MKKKRSYFLIFGVLLTFFSCADLYEPEETPEEKAKRKESLKQAKERLNQTLREKSEHRNIREGLDEYIIKDLQVGKEHSVLSPRVLYSLETNKVLLVTAFWEKQEPNQKEGRISTDWDIEFKGIYNGYISPNHKNVRESSGWQGNAEAEIFLWAKEEIEDAYWDYLNSMPDMVPPRQLFNTIFDELEEVPQDQLGKSRDSIGTHGTIVGTQGKHRQGYSFYDFYGILFPNAPKDGPQGKAHVSYSLPKIVIVKTAKGNWAKMIVTSKYEGNPEEPSRGNNPGFFNFRYIINREGEKVFK